MFSSIDSRGIEEEVLKGLDSSILVMYQHFKSALNDKKLTSLSKSEFVNYAMELTDFPIKAIVLSKHYIKQKHEKYRFT